MLREGALALALTAVLNGTAIAGMTDEENLDPWEVCALCHSLDGISRMAKFPKLAGQRQAYIEKQLRDFASSHRSNDGGQMAAIASDLDEEKRVAVARYFAELPPPPPVPSAARDPRIVELIDGVGPNPSAPACMACHAVGRVAESGAPRLEAQHADYISKQLHDFRSGRRENDPGGVMRGVASGLSDQDIDLMARELASRTRKANVE